MAFLDRYFEQARSHPARIVFPESLDERILKATSRLTADGLADIVLLGNDAEIGAAAAACDVSLDAIEIINPAESSRLDAYAALYQQNRPQAKEAMALRAVRKPLYYGAMMVRSGDADTALAGAASPTRRVIEAAGLCVGLADGIETPSSFFLMLPSATEPLVFADCAINVEPSAAELADITIASANSAAKILGCEPRVAMLSFSTLGSANHASVDKVRLATELVRARSPGLQIEGEIQVDAALDPAVSLKKAGEKTPVPGNANVLIFPDLNAGNIGYKLVQRLGGAEAIGPILQGFSKPVADLSRGASVDDIVTTAVLTSALR